MRDFQHLDGTNHTRTETILTLLFYYPKNIAIKTIIINIVGIINDPVIKVAYVLDILLPELYTNLCTDGGTFLPGMLIF